MADLASSDVSYSEVSRTRISDSGLRHRQFKIEFGDGALTYPAGGVPLDSAQLGGSNELVSFALEDSASADGFLYKYDSVNKTIRIYQGDNDNVADAPLIELGNVAVAATDLYARVDAY